MMGFADNGPAKTAGGFRGLAARWPLLTFLALTAVTGWPLMWLIPLSSHGYLNWGDIEKPASLGLVICMFAAMLYVTWAGEGRDGVVRILRRAAKWRFGLFWWFIVLLGIPLVAFGFGIAVGGKLQLDDAGWEIVSQAWTILYTLLLVNLWEESVWAGFFQTRLERRHNIFVASAITALPFLWVHMPLAFVKAESFGDGMQNVAMLFILIILFRPLLAFVLRGAADSILAVGLIHSVFNRTTNVDGLLEHMLDGVEAGLCTLVAVIVLLFVTAVVGRRKLSRAYRVEVLDKLDN